MPVSAEPGPRTAVTAADRETRGRQARRLVPRRAHGAWMPAPDRQDPVTLLERQEQTRVPELVPIRHGRMLASPFAFYRGAAAVMAADLAGTPDSGIHVQLCGDAHAANFGVFSAPDRRLVFDLNDFDETHVGPWEWDVKRLVASLEIAGREREFRTRERRLVVSTATKAYRDAMRGFAAAGDMEVWYSRLDVDDVIERLSGEVSADTVRRARIATDRARGKTSTRALRKLTTREGGRLRFRSEPPLLVRLEDIMGDAIDDLSEALSAMLDGYRASLSPELARLMSGYRAVDMARKVVGVGSVGTRAWVVLLEGRDEHDGLVLQAKEAEASVLEEHLGASVYTHHGERVVRGQRFMQAAGDLLLGWQRVNGIDGRARDFYVRQLWDGKGGADLETMSAERMAVYGRLCGWTLARAHARSGDRIAIAAYLGGGDAFDRAMVAFADVYAVQNQLDHRAFEQAAGDGRIDVVSGV